MSTIFKTIKLFEEEQAQTNTSTYMQVKTLVDKMDKGGRKRVADALKKSLGVVTEGVEPQQQLQQLQQQQYSMEAVVNQVRQATRAIKHDDTIHNIIVEIRQLAEKAGIDASELRYSENQVSEAFNQLASEVYGLEEAFTDKLSDIQNQVEELEYQLENPDEELDEAGSWKQQAAIAIAMKNKGKKPKSEGVAEGSQKVDSLVTDSLKIMRGPEVNDAVSALKTVLGNREYNDRRGFYNFYVRQLMDMYGKKGLAEETMEEGWSQKYKKSINCSHPKGFSQKAHCAGKKKHNESVETHVMEMTCPDCGMCQTHGDHLKDNLDEACWKGYHKEGNKKMFGKTYPNCVKNEGVAEAHHSESCPHCGGEMVSEELMNEKKDACYYKVKSRYKVWPSAYASGALVKCRKKGASNWGTGGKKNESSILEGLEQVDENLHQWFKEKWVRFGPDGKIRGDCARGDDSEGKPKCLPQSKAHSLGKKGRASAASRKRREDPNPKRHGKAINVNTKKKTKE